MVRREQFSGHTPEDNGIDGEIVHNGSVGGGITKGRGRDGGGDCCVVDGGGDDSGSMKEV